MASIVYASLSLAALLAASFLPFLPGGYDPLSRPLASMAWVFGRAGLLLVPVGGLWLLVPGRAGASLKPHGWLVWLTRGTCTFIALLLVLIAFAFGPLLATLTAVIAGLGILRLGGKLRAAALERSKAPALLGVLPLAVLAAQLACLEPISLHARNRVLANSAPLIAEIEQYRDRHGAYPVSIFALYGDVKPGVVGVQRYYYERSGDAYNLIFEQPEPAFGLRRFVVFNPRDQQRLTVHETDRLQLDEAGLEADNAGYTLIEPLPQQHWKVFTFRS